MRRILHIRKLFLFGFWLSSVALAQQQTPLTQTSDSSNNHVTASTALEKQHWTIGFFHAPPLGFLNEKNQPDGFIVDLLNHIAQQHKLNITWQYGEFPDLLNAAKLGAIDILPGLGFTKERARSLIYSNESFANVWGQVFLPINSKVESILDLNGKTVAMLNGGINGENFLRHCNQFEVSVQSVYSNSYDEVFNLLASGKADAVVANNVYGLYMAKKYDFFASNIMFNPFKVFITQNPDSHRAFLALYDRSLQEWKKDPDSFYYKTRQKWLDVASDKPLPQWLYYSLFSVLLVALGALIAAVLYHHKFHKSTAVIMAQRKQLRQIINHMPHLIFLHNNQGDVLLINHSASEFFGLAIMDTGPLNIYQFVAQNPKYKGLIENDSASNIVYNDVKVVNDQEQMRNLMVSKTWLSDDTGKSRLLLTVAVDMTDIRNFEHQIKHLVEHDELTGLANINLIRQHLQQGIDECADKSCHGALLFIDIDHFKTLNDAQGHRLGDIILKTVAERLSNLARTNDLVGRLSSDVFLVHLSNLNENAEMAQNKAVKCAEVICERISEPIVYHNKTYHVTACIGLSLYPRDGNRVSLLLQRADTALYEAKNRGRSRIRVFHQDMEQAVKERHTLETDIHQALKNDDIKLVYQPIVTFSENNCNGWEALARWQHPKRGLLMPDTFIPIIEQSSLMPEFGFWVFERVCQTIQQHHTSHSGQSFYISANLSVSQLKDRRFIDNISRLINQYAIKPGMLELEITESIAMYESKQAADILNQLKLMGIRIAIDDFGTGYSSFTQLKQLPIDKIKIDQSFIEDVPNNTEHAAMIKSIIAMARAIQLDVVAEGVETRSQYEFLQTLDCDFYQGFYFAKPSSQLRFKS